MKKTCCVFIIYGDYLNKFHFFNHNSVKSFKKWHPDIDVHIVGDNYPNEEFAIKCMKTWKSFFNSYEKVICLDADTITCAHFDEFINDDDTPILATLDFPMWPAGYTHDVKVFNLPHNTLEYYNVNSGVVCFNNSSVIDHMISLYDSKKLNKNADQEAIQYLATYEPNLVKVVDFPYLFSPFVYNVRGHGTLGTGCIHSDGSLHFGFDGNKIGEFSPIYAYKPKDDKLYNHLGKHVKCFHFATRDKKLKHWFNEDTIKFFVDHCLCDWSLENIV